MTHEEISTDLPRQLQRKNPNARKPHAGVIVEIAGFNEFVCPRIERRNAGSPLDGLGDHARTIGFARQPRERCVEVAPVVRPHEWPRFQPAFPIRAPENFLNELLRARERMAGEDGAQNLIFGDQPRANVRREHGDVRPIARAAIFVARGSVRPPRVR